ncbi:MAG: hypothetical protein CML29_08140 [Rhizobiales bacterium]|nr:hypothetical protein [Hyphomicrobiales bacterium]
MSIVDRLAGRMSLRLRIFLFFALAALASIALIAVAGYFALMATNLEDRTFVLRAGIVSCFGILGILAAIWYQFDSHVARPVERLGRYARATAHGEGLAEAAMPEARYLGYLAPALNDLSRSLEKARNEREAAVQEATARAERQKARLEFILQDLSDGILICNRDHEILLYNPAAVEILADIGRIGLRRSVFDVLAPEPVRHNLSRLEKRVREGRHKTHELGLSQPFAALCADGRTTLEATMTLTLVPGSAETQGYVLAFSDETEMLAASAEAERKVVAVAERIREHAGSLQLIGEMLAANLALDARARDLTGSIMDEIGLLAETSDELERLAVDEFSRTWPMGPVLATTLFDLVRERVRLKVLPETRCPQQIAILCDSAAIAALSARLCEWVTKRGGTNLLLSAEPGEETGFLDIEWSGEPVSIRSTDRWLRSALDHDLGPVTAADVLARHGADIWSDRAPASAGRARFRIPLQMRDMASLPVITARHIERMPVYDFDIFDEKPPAELADRSLRSLTVVVFDTETTGLEPSRGDRMVSIAGVRIVNGRLLESEIFDELIHPGRAIPRRSTEVHGITDSMVADAAPAGEVVARFARFAENAVLVAHNAPFDMRFLTMAGEASGLEFHNPVLDTVLLAAHVHGTGESLTLDRLAEIYRVDLPDEVRHTALGDSLATAKVFLALLGPLAASGVTTLGEAVQASEAQAALRRKQTRYE